MNANSLESPAAAPIDLLPHRLTGLPVLVLMAHSRCNCRCLMCDIWKIRQIREITAEDLEPHLASLRALKVRWVVFSGGEPLLHSDLFALARVLRREGIRTTLLTAGLTLARHAARVTEDLDDVIVSLDGPREIHDRIRGVPDAYRRLERGIHTLRDHRASIPIQGRCTVQKNNFQHLRETVGAARDLRLDSLSFLAADISSDAFNHAGFWGDAERANIALNGEELEALSEAIDGLINDCQAEIRSGFIRENPDKLRRIVRHWAAHLGQAAPVAPRCNAPWVSAVIESGGAVRPCFFHPSFGNIHDGTLMEVLNSRAAVQFRNQLDVSRNAICQRCVCSLYLEPNGASATRTFVSSTTHFQPPSSA